MIGNYDDIGSITSEGKVVISLSPSWASVDPKVNPVSATSHGDVMS